MVVTDSVNSVKLSSESFSWLPSWVVILTRNIFWHIDRISEIDRLIMKRFAIRLAYDLTGDYPGNMSSSYPVSYYQLFLAIYYLNTHVVNEV